MTTDRLSLIYFLFLYEYLFSLCLMINEQKLPKFAKGLLNLAVVPECLTSTLQIVNFEKVDGDEQELLSLAEFLLEKGKIL